MSLTDIETCLMMLFLGWLFYVIYVKPIIQTRPAVRGYRRWVPRQRVKYHMKHWNANSEHRTWERKVRGTIHVNVPARSRKHFNYLVRKMETQRECDRLDDMCQ